MAYYGENSSTSLQLHRRTDPQIGQQRVSQVIAGMPQRSSNEGWVVVHSWEGGGFIAWGCTVAPTILILMVLFFVLWWFLRA